LGSEHLLQGSHLRELLAQALLERGDRRPAPLANKEDGGVDADHARLLPLPGAVIGVVQVNVEACQPA
jgi:hypothetical protein